MNIVILTTDTPCHAQFVRHIAAAFKIKHVFCERERPPKEKDQRGALLVGHSLAMLANRLPSFHFDCRRDHNCTC